MLSITAGTPIVAGSTFSHLRTWVNLATKAVVQGTNRLRIHTPLIDLTKGQIIAKGLALGVDYSLTLSCYDPQSDAVPCGRW